MNGLRTILRGKLFKMAVLGAASIGVWAVYAQDPYLQLTDLTTNTVRVTITNGLGSAYYSLQQRVEIGTNIWSLVQTGSQGQVIFDIEKGALRQQFFRVIDGNDWDNDGVVNARDAQPLNAGISNLVITVESPTSGQVLQ